MQTLIQDHWLSSATRIPSPNFNDRPVPDRIDLLVIHNISLPPGEFGGDYISQLFTNCLDPKAHPYFAEIAGLCVSSHVLIRRDGEAIQYVPFNKRAWHAGESCFDGEANCNDFSIGIELEGDDDTDFEEEQYQRLAKVTKLLMWAYRDICPERIAGHNEIAPERKTDPGPKFDWNYYRRLIEE